MVMVVVPVSHLREGVRIIDEVRSPKGRVLFQKQHVISEKDIHIMQAFLVKYVHVDVVDQNDVKEDMQTVVPRNMVAFFMHYEKLMRIMIETCRLIQSGQERINIPDIRNELNSLLKYTDVFNPCTFSPPPVLPNDPFDLRFSIVRALSSHALAAALQLPEKDMMPIALGALLCDIGITKLMTTTYATNEEFMREYKKHTWYGFELLGKILGINEGTRLCAHQHHEMVNGQGYPQGLVDTQIHIYAKIVAISDRFHRFMMKQQECDAFHPMQSIELFMKEMNGVLDGAMVAAFAAHITGVQHGAVVQLNDGQMAKIAIMNPNNVLRPVIELDGRLFRLTDMPECMIDRVHADAQSRSE